jgi:hypothetical protein
LDYKLIDGLNENVIKRMRNEENMPRKKEALLNHLIGNFPKFMMEQKYGRYLYFFTGGSNYINLLEYPKIQEWIQTVSPDIKRKMGISALTETLVIKADEFHNLLREVGIEHF